MRALVLILAFGVAAPAWADAPATSLRPSARPVAAQPAAATAAAKVDPEKAEAVTAAPATQDALARAAPQEKPKGLAKLFKRTTQQAPKRYPVKGSVCNDRTIRGKEVGQVAGRGACGIKSAVRITEVGGVRLSSSALVECTTAHSLNAWVQNIARPALEKTGGGLAEMKVLSSYACRTRNSRPGARLSEHAKGRAIDIGGFTLADGTDVSVLNGWRDKTFGPILVDMHAGACGRFGTVLGPRSDRFHQDHFHFDTARYRSGPYCR